MIDLQATRPDVVDLIADSLSSFAQEEPDVIWSNFALYACPWSGWISTCFDTESRSSEHVAKFAKNGPDWYGEDEWGRFCDNCPDIQFVEWRLLNLDQWEEEYQTADPIHIRDLDGRDHFIGDSNEEINGMVFAYLRTVLFEEMTKSKTGSQMQGARRRYGVQLLDSRFVEFWRFQPTDD